MIRVRLAIVSLLVLCIVACGQVASPSANNTERLSNVNVVSSPVASSTPIASPTATPNPQSREREAQLGGRTERIQFARGRTSAVIRGETPPAAFDRYTVAAREGQRMSVRVESEEEAVKFDVYIPAADPEDYENYIFLTTPNERARWGTTRWSGRLPQTGDYEIEVGSRPGGARYTLTVTIR